jgi:hypothetical protein
MINIGIISEGVKDQGIIENILKAIAKNLELDIKVSAIRPNLSKSQIQINNPNNQTIGTLQGVKNACLTKEDFENFFVVEDNKFITIHLDTAEIDRQDFDFEKPPKENKDDYSAKLRKLVIKKIEEWIGQEYLTELTNNQHDIFYAIAIEEIEAWCLTIFEKEDTTYLDNLKNKLDKHLAQRDLTYKKLKLDPKKDKKLYFETFTKKYNFHKMKELEQYYQYNQSLKDFVESVKDKFHSSNK